MRVQLGLGDVLVARASSCNERLPQGYDHRLTLGGTGLLVHPEDGLDAGDGSRQGIASHRGRHRVGPRGRRIHCGLLRRHRRGGNGRPRHLRRGGGGRRSADTAVQLGAQDAFHLLRRLLQPSCLRSL